LPYLLEQKQNEGTEKAKKANCISQRVRMGREFNPELLPKLLPGVTFEYFLEPHTLDEEKWALQSQISACTPSLTSFSPKITCFG